MTSQKYFTDKEVAGILGITLRQLYRRRKDGDAPAHFSYRHRNRTSLAAMAAYLASRDPDRSIHKLVKVMDVHLQRSGGNILVTADFLENLVHQIVDHPERSQDLLTKAVTSIQAIRDQIPVLEEVHKLLNKAKLSVEEKVLNDFLYRLLDDGWYRPIIMPHYISLGGSPGVATDLGSINISIQKCAEAFMKETIQ